MVEGPLYIGVMGKWVNNRILCCSLGGEMFYFKYLYRLQVMAEAWCKTFTFSNIIFLSRALRFLAKSHSYLLKTIYLK